MHTSLVIAPYSESMTAFVRVEAGVLIRKHITIDYITLDL